MSSPVDQTYNGAPGAVQLSSRALIPASPGSACQTESISAEPNDFPSDCKNRTEGHAISRRTALNMLVSTVAISSSTPLAAPENDLRLVELEREILAEYEIATQHEDEIIRLREQGYAELRSEETKHLPVDEQVAIWERAKNAPECREADRLIALGDPHFDRMDALTKEMLSIPATTAQGRRAKLSVFFETIAHERWTRSNHDADYDMEIGRRLLLEFAGNGAAGEWTEQFAREALNETRKL